MLFIGPPFLNEVVKGITKEIVKGLFVNLIFLVVNVELKTSLRVTYPTKNDDSNECS